MILKDRESFLEKSNGIRPKVETTFSSVKSTIAQWLRSRKKMMQRKEGYTCIIAYNPSISLHRQVYRKSA